MQEAKLLSQYKAQSDDKKKHDDKNVFGSQVWNKSVKYLLGEGSVRERNTGGKHCARTKEAEWLLENFSGLL